MSVARTAIRKRRQARLDERYVMHRRKSVEARSRRAARVLETERRIKSKGKS